MSNGLKILSGRFHLMAISRRGKKRRNAIRSVHLTHHPYNISFGHSSIHLFRISRISFPFKRGKSESFRRSTPYCNQLDSYEYMANIIWLRGRGGVDYIEGSIIYTCSSFLSSSFLLLSSWISCFRYVTGGKKINNLPRFPARENVSVRS